LMTSAFHKQLRRLEFERSSSLSSWNWQRWKDEFPWESIPVWDELTHLVIQTLPLFSLGTLFQKAPNLTHLYFRITESLKQKMKEGEKYNFFTSRWVPDESSNRSELCADTFQHAKKLRRFVTHLYLDPFEEDEVDCARWRGILKACPSLESFYVMNWYGRMENSDGLYWDMIKCPQHAALLQEFQYCVDFFTPFKEESF
jgi:hypothetical protein